MVKAKIVVALLELTKTEWFRRTIIFLVLTPFILLFGFILLISSIISSLIGSMHNPKTPHKQAILELKIEYDISNDLSDYLLRSIDLFMDYEYMTSISQVKLFAKTYFVDSNHIYKKDDYGNEWTETIYLFKDHNEVLECIKLPPFSLTEDDILVIESFENIEMGFLGKFPMPVNDYVLTSDYGYRIHPVTGVTKIHTGMDLSPPHHSPIMSMTDGVIVNVNTTKGNAYGNNVTIKHQLDTETIYSFYAHLSEIHVSKGQKVVQGEVIGLEGGDPETDPNPGTSTGHHLHFEVWTNYGSSYHTDPKNYLSNWLKSFLIALVF